MNSTHWQKMGMRKKESRKENPGKIQRNSGRKQRFFRRLLENKDLARKNGE